MTVDELCSFIWWKMTHNMEKQSEIDALRAKLWQPPPDNKAPIPVKSPWSADSEMKAFRGLQSQLGQGLKQPARSASDPLSPSAR